MTLVCGAGAMLTQSKLFATDTEGEVKPNAIVHFYGEDNKGEMYATCKSDMLLKSKDTDKIRFVSTESNLHIIKSSIKELINFIFQNDIPHFHCLAEWGVLQCFLTQPD